MKTITVQMSREPAGIGMAENLVVPTIHWPRQCPCCGAEVKGASLRKLSHMPGLGVSSTGKLLSADLSWRVPVCGRCSVHFALDKVILVVLCALPPLLWVGSAYLLFQAGYSDPNVLVIVLWLIGGAALISLAYGAWKLFRILERTTLLRESCRGVHFPVRVTSTYPRLDFDIEDDEYADKFRALNPGSA